MKLSRLVNMMLLSTAIVSCSDLKSPDLVPCMCDGTEKTLGLFECMCEPGKKKPVKRRAYIQNEPKIDPTQEQLNAYAYLHQSRNQYAPVKLDYVDFRIPKGQYYEQYTNKLGNYRFRIFGCRRFDKEVFLNQGRAMQKDMKFFDIFYETMNDYYPVVVEKNNPYYMYSDKAQAEYVLTAEINDYFMNVCDEFDWDNVKKKDLRTGTSEMTVTWRLMDLTKNKVYCKGTTTGYGEMKDGEYKGEVLLVERAFADALSKLPQIKCYNESLAQRVKPEVIEKQLAQIKAQEKSKITFKNQYAEELNGVNALQSCGSKDLKPQDLLPASIKDSTFSYENSNTNFAYENGNTKSSVKFASDVENNLIKGYINEEGKFVIVDDKGNVVEDANFESNANFVSDMGDSVAKGQIISGYVDENGKFVVVDNGDTKSKYAYISENGGSDIKNNIIKGYIDEKGKFVIVDDNGNIIENANFESNANFVSDMGDSIAKGQIISGYIDENGKFVVVDNGDTNSRYAQITERGDVLSKGRSASGYIDENGKFVIVDERGNVSGKGQTLKGYVDESGKFVVINSSVEEKGGFKETGRIFKGYMDEDGNFVTLSSKTQANIKTENNQCGKQRNLAGYIDDNGGFVAINSAVSERGDVVGCGQLLNGFINERQEFVLIDEAGGAEGRGYEIAGMIEADGRFTSKAAIEERSGGMSKFNSFAQSQTKKLRLNDNCSEVTIGEAGCTSIKVADNTIKYNDDYWIDMPIEENSGSVAIQNRLAAEKMYSDSYSNFCIQSVKPYESLSPQNMYRLRASVVSVENPSGKKGAGLIISDQLILTSADLVDKQQNRFNIKTINGMDYTGSAFRVNPNKNVALILLDEKTKFNPLPLRLNLPEVGKEMFMTLGLLDFDQGENYLETEGEVIGYRYSEDKGAEIIVNTFVQTQTLGSSLIDKNGNVTGLSHSGIRTKEGGDLFIPIETALKSVGLNICGVKFTNKKPIALKAIDKPVSTAIDNSKGSKAPKAMSVKERK